MPSQWLIFSKQTRLTCSRYRSAIMWPMNELSENKNRKHQKFKTGTTTETFHHHLWKRTEKNKTVKTWISRLIILRNEIYKYSHHTEGKIIRFQLTCLQSNGISMEKIEKNFLRKLLNFTAARGTDQDHSTFHSKNWKSATAFCKLKQNVFNFQDS